MRFKNLWSRPFTSHLYEVLEFCSICPYLRLSILIQRSSWCRSRTLSIFTPCCPYRPVVSRPAIRAEDRGSNPGPGQKRMGHKFSLAPNSSSVSFTITSEKGIILPAFRWALDFGLSRGMKRRKTLARGINSSRGRVKSLIRGWNKNPSGPGG